MDVIKLLKGEHEYRIPCQASGNPPPYIIWYKDNEIIINSEIFIKHQYFSYEIISQAIVLYTHIFLQIITVVLKWTTRWF